MAEQAAAPSETQEELLKVLASANNRQLLSLLAVEATYPRKLGNLLGLSEAEIARRLRHMEGLGLVTSQWSYVGKNIKLYRLAADRITLKFTPQGLTLDFGKDAGVAKSITVVPLEFQVPHSDLFVGRKAELDILRGNDQVVVVEGMAGIGKTSLLARFVESMKEPHYFWHGFRGLESLAWLINRMGRFLAQFGDQRLLHLIEKEADLSDQREMALQAIDDARFTVILDDVHRVEDPALRSFIGDLLDRTDRARVIVAGREAPRFNATRPRRRILRLSGLTAPDVGEFLGHRQVTLAAPLLPKVQEEVGGHPLALALLLEAASELKVPIEKLLDRIPERQIEDYLLREVLGTLSDDERTALAHASLFRATFTPNDLSSVTKKDHEHTLQKLRRKLLVQTVGTAYLLPEVIRNFFYAQLHDKEALHAKAAAHYLSRETIDGRLEALHHLKVAKQRDRILGLLEQNLDLHEFDFIDAGYQHLYAEVLGSFKREDVKDARRWALIQDEQGDIRFHQGDWQGALRYYDESAKLLDGKKDPERVADLCWKRAQCHEKLGKGTSAAELCDEGLGVAPLEGVARPRLEELRKRLGPAPAAASAPTKRAKPKAR